MKETDIEIQELEALDINLLKQIDRTEIVESIYMAHPLEEGLGLELRKTFQDPPVSIPAWNEKGISHRLAKWQSEIERGGILLAAVKRQSVRGFGLIGPIQTDSSIELCALFVSSESRRSGAGAILFQQLEAKAKAQGAKSLLIYGNPTQSSVHFYLRQKCQIIGLADKRLAANLPLDVIFAKAL